MKKLFLIPLMTLVCSVMAWGATTITVGEGGDHATLSDAVAAAEAGDVVQLVSDLTGESCAFSKAITVDFNGHTIQSSNYGLEVTATVTFTDNSLAQNGGIIAGKGCLDVYGKAIINGGTFTSTVTGSGAAIWCEKGSEIEVNDINMNASESGIYVESGRMIINGGNIVADKCVALQLGSGYFEINGGTIISNSSLTNQGRDGGRSYAVISGGTFVMNGGSISGVQGGLSLQEDCAGTINNGEIETRHGVDGQHNNHYALYVSTGAVVNVYDGKFKVETPSMGENKVVLCDDNDLPENVYGIANIYGGKYAKKVNVGSNKYGDANSTYPSSVPLTSQWYSSFGSEAPLPAGYEYYETGDAEYPYGVQPIAGKKTDEIESTETTIPWQQSTTWAKGEVPENNTIVTIPVGKTVVVSKDETEKEAVADQIFINKGASLTVQEGTALTVGDGGVNIANGGSVTVEPGAVVKIGAAGVITAEDEALVLESTEDAQAILLYDPAVKENTQPKATVKLTTKSNMLEGDPTWKYTYQRFAIPVQEAVVPVNDFNSATHEFFPGEESYGFESYVYYWTGHNWANTSWNALVPFKGYQLANNSKNGGVTYTFTGNLIGNEDGEFEFTERGFDYFGNSYTAPINVEEFLSGFGSDVEATIWLYNYGTKNWQNVALEDITDGIVDDEFKQIKSMDGFLLNLRAASGSAPVDYANAIWGNPMLPAHAPARNKVASNINNSAVITVKDNAGFGDNLTLVEKDNYTNAFENGADATKYILPEGVSLYAETLEGKLGRVATNDLSNTIISFRSGDNAEYTLTFGKVNGEDYLLRDNVTGMTMAIAEGATYTFTQEANTTSPARFEIVAVAKVTTAIENVEAEAKAHGIYSIAGQFLGNDFSKLPAGVYVVNGVKIVK